MNNNFQPQNIELINELLPLFNISLNRFVSNYFEFIETVNTITNGDYAESMATSHILAKSMLKVLVTETSKDIVPNVIRDIHLQLIDINNNLLHLKSEINLDGKCSIYIKMLLDELKYVKQILNEILKLY